eukprot:3940917-Rhodomonas_salina.6
MMYLLLVPREDDGEGEVADLALERISLVPHTPYASSVRARHHGMLLRQYQTSLTVPHALRQHEYKTLRQHRTRQCPPPKKNKRGKGGGVGTRPMAMRTAE